MKDTPIHPPPPPPSPCSASLHFIALFLIYSCESNFFLISPLANRGCNYMAANFFSKQQFFPSLLVGHNGEII
jgi:hypothetical protein